MYTFLIIIHTVACMALIAVVLLQKGKGADMGAAFGGASQTLFGGSGGSTFMGKLTTGAAVLFMLTCLSLSYFTIKPDARSLMEEVEVEMPVHKGPDIPDPSPIMPLLEQTPEGAGDRGADVVQESPEAIVDPGAGELPAKEAPAQPAAESSVDSLAPAEADAGNEAPKP